MIGDAHKRHDRKHNRQCADMHGDDEDEGGDEYSAGYRFPWVKAHRRPCGRRAAGVMNGVRQFERARAVHAAVSPVEPTVVQQERDQD
jgi:hypothetical protein